MASSNDRNSLSANIKAICDYLNLSEYQFMRECDINRSCLTRLKSGETKSFSLENMQKLGTYTKLLTDELLYDSPSKVLRKFIERQKLMPHNYAHLYALISA